MPAKKQKKNESRIVNMRAHMSDVCLFDKVAKYEGKTRSSFLVDCAKRKAIKVLKAQHSTGKTCPLCGHNEVKHGRK